MTHEQQRSAAVSRTWPSDKQTETASKNRSFRELTHQQSSQVEGGI